MIEKLSIATWNSCNRVITVNYRLSWNWLIQQGGAVLQQYMGHTQMNDLIHVFY